MKSSIALFSLCLIAVLAFPAWGGSKNDCTKNTPQQVAANPAPIALPGGYVRDPANIKERQHYLKCMQQKAKEAAANRAAATATQAGQQNATPPKQTRGGSQ